MLNKTDYAAPVPLTRIAVLVSGGGTNLQALIDAQKAGKLRSGKIELVLSNNPNAYALKRASDAGIPQKIVSKSDYLTKEAAEEAILAALADYSIELVILAGFMTILSRKFVEVYANRILNVHPSLIPAFCGKGMYGLHVHEAALEKGVKLTGATVHLVNEIPDGGEILLQKSVAVKKNDTPETLQKRVMEQAEWILLPRAAEMQAKKIQLQKKKKSDREGLK